MRDGYLPRVNLRLTVVLRELPICGGYDMRTSIQRPRLAEAIEPPFNFALNRPVCWRDTRLILNALRAQVRLRSMSQMCHVWTAPCWQELFSRFAALVGAAMCSAF